MQEDVPDAKVPPTTTAAAPVKMPIAEWIFAAIVIAVEGINILVSPGYYGPFAATPIGLVILILVFGWQAIGLALICIPQSSVLKWPAIVRWSVVPLFCTIPVFAVLMLGPAILTIINALGPVTTR
jgi:hypothetical protein